MIFGAFEIAGVVVALISTALAYSLARTARERMERSREETALLIELQSAVKKSPERVHEFLNQV